MSLVQINWKPDATELRKFGWSMLIGFGLIGALFYFGVWPAGGLRNFPLGHARPTVGVVCWFIAAVAGALGLSGSRAALPVYWAWMGVAFVLGSVIGRVLLAGVFYLVFSPMGVVMRLMGRDPLRLKRREVGTYWVELPPTPSGESYGRQF